jgi:hypothetical protein
MCCLAKDAGLDPTVARSARQVSPKDKDRLGRGEASDSRTSRVGRVDPSQMGQFAGDKASVLVARGRTPRGARDASRDRELLCSAFSGTESLPPGSVSAMGQFTPAQ